MKLTGDWITAEGVQHVCAVLQQGGHQALLVGGCVRNALLGAPVSDIDIATDARPERVMALATAAGLRAVPTGIDHGTVTLIHGAVPHEVTTFRRDVQTDGRHAVVAFSETVEEDARRRDFTMNALYVRADGTLVDPLGGMADLHARRVRFIEDAAQRIREDYLRILRFFRFHAWYGDPEGGLDAEALAAIADNLDGLAQLSRERVGAELVKLLSAPDPAPALAGMRACGVLMALLPGADDRALPALVHLEGAQGVAPDPIRRLAALGGAEDGSGLRLSRAQLRQLATLRDALSDGQAAAALGHLLGLIPPRDVLLLRAALMGQAVLPADWVAAARGAEAVFPVSAADLMPALQGPALGARLADLRQRWIASGFALGRDALLSGLPPDTPAT